MYINLIKEPLSDCEYIQPCVSNWADISSQVDKHPGAIYTDRDAIYLDPISNYRLITSN